MQHLKPRSTTVVIYQGDDMDQLAHLKRAVDIATRTAKLENARVGDDNAAVETAQAAYDAFVDEAADRALEVELRSIGSRRFRDLIAEHPPRMVDSASADETTGQPKQVEHEDDAQWGVNTETFPPALLCYREGDLVTIARPEFPTAAAVKAFIEDELAEGDYDTLWVAALMLNRSPSADPKLHARSTSGSGSTDAT